MNRDKNDIGANDFYHLLNVAGVSKDLPDVFEMPKMLHRFNKHCSDDSVAVGLVYALLRYIQTQAKTIEFLEDRL